MCRSSLIAKASITVENIKWASILGKVVITGLLSGIALSSPLWLGNRFFPYTPVFNLYPAEWVHSVLTVSFIVMSLLAWVFEKQWFYVWTIIIGLTLVMFDQVRLQPWIYIYLIMLVPFAFNATGEALLNKYCKIIMTGIYFWSGVHKLNPDFITGYYAEWLSFIQGRQINMNEFVSLSGYGPGLIEISVAVLLAIQKTRKAGVWLASVMHIIVCIVVLGQGYQYNSVVIPWNMVMVALTFLVFYGRVDVLSGDSAPERIVFPGLAVLLIWLLPILNFANSWDHYLSFSFYSNKPSAFYIAIQTDQLSKIDSRFRSYFVNIPGLTGGQIIDVNRWCVSELNVPFYPEPRVFKRLSRDFCKLNIPSHQIVFLEIKRPSGQNREVLSFNCD